MTGSNCVSKPMRLRRSVFCVLLAVAAFAQSPKSTPTSILSPDQMRDLIRKAADNDVENDKKQRDYTYTERQEVRRLDGKGQVKSTEVKTYDVMEIYGEQVQKLVSKDDKTLSEKEARKEDDKIQKLIDKRKNESESDREKRLRKEAKEREDDRQFVREVADAYILQYVGVESLAGRENYVIAGDPKPGYQPIHKEAKILTKTKFRVWIDKEDSQMSKLNVELLDTASFGLFLARLHKGAHVTIENTRVNDEVWLQQHVSVKLDARIALLKDFNVDVDVTDRDYKKFRTDTKIQTLGEVAPQK